MPIRFDSVQEDWLPIPEFPGYWVSRSKKVRNKNGRILQTVQRPGRYIRTVTLRFEGATYCRSVDKLRRSAEDAVGR